MHCHEYIIQFEGNFTHAKAYQVCLRTKDFLRLRWIFLKSNVVVARGVKDCLEMNEMHLLLVAFSLQTFKVSKSVLFC